MTSLKQLQATTLLTAFLLTSIESQCAKAASTGAEVSPSTTETSSTSESKAADSKEKASNGKDDKKDAKEAQPHIFKPLVWGCNDEFKLQFGGDTRIRAEKRDNFDMDRKIGDNDTLGFIRTRVNLDMTYCESWRAFVEILDAREVDSRVDQQQESHVDLHQAFIEWADKKRTPWGIRLGRQEMEFGRDRRLSEASGWGNLRRRFDGVKLMYRTEDLDVDTFLMHPNYYDYIRGSETVTRHGRPRTDEYFYGTYATLRHWKPHTLEAYFLGLTDKNNHRTFPRPVQSEDGEFGTTDRYTIGSALYGPLWKREGCGTLSYGLEGAFQFGQRANDNLNAHMMHGDINYEWEHPWKPKLTLLGNLASGDKQRGDESANTFNPLFGSTHSPYGIIDFARLQNLRELALLGSVNPTEKLKTQIELHSFWLDSKTDSWVDSRGNSLGRDATGKSGRHLGNEICGYAQYKLTKCVTLETGASHFFSGTFADKVGRDDGANFLYVQTTIAF